MPSFKQDIFLTYSLQKKIASVVFRQNFPDIIYAVDMLSCRLPSHLLGDVDVVSVASRFLRGGVKLFYIQRFSSSRLVDKQD